MKLFCATTNPGKLREFRLAVEEFGKGRFELVELPNLRDLPAAPEDGSTFEENAAHKALYYSAHTDGYLFADDSGLSVRALGGDPGVRSARYAGEHAGDAANNRLLLERLKSVKDRAAEFVCVIALAREGRLVATFRGAVEGRIIDDARGVNGFGYDPLFFHEPFGCTFGQASAAEKLSTSHRARAVAQMLEFCKDLT